MDLVKEIYGLTEAFPKDETYGLKSQMERAAVSIPSQIAEGYLRSSRKEYLYFLSVALGSSAELETQILVCKSVSKFKNIEFLNAEVLLEEVMKNAICDDREVKRKTLKNLYPFPLTLYPLQILRLGHKIVIVQLRLIQFSFASTSGKFELLSKEFLYCFFIISVFRPGFKNWVL